MAKVGAKRTFAGFWFTKRERRDLVRRARGLCDRFGHSDRMVEIFGHWMPRCRDCLTFPMKERS